MDSGRLIHVEDPERLQAAWPLQDLTVYACAFIRRLVATSAQTRHMQQDVR